MVQYKKLFSNAEIEYITPFLKLWMSFNNWYKQDLGISTDREAINEYKESGGKVRYYFLQLLNSRSNEAEEFQNALFKLILNLNNYSFEESVFPESQLHLPYAPNLIEENPDGRTHPEHTFLISQTHRIYYIREQDKEDFFKQTLEIIYQIRCCLVHGDFDIEDEYFIELINSSYKILYPVIKKILDDAEERLYYCKNRKGTDALGEFQDGKIKVLRTSKICKEVVSSYERPEERIESLRENAREEDSFFILTRDIEFPSPSAASSFCLGNNSNGWIDWKNKEGKTLNNILRNN